MGMKIMQPQLVEKGLFDDLVGENERFDSDCPHQPAKGPRQMPVDENRVAVHTVAGNIGNIVLAIYNLDPPAYRLHGIEQDAILDVLGFVPDFAVEIHHPA
jgi:hypothetical protein